MDKNGLAGYSGISTASTEGADVRLTSREIQ
jgi:hypothetical protein